MKALDELVKQKPVFLTSFENEYKYSHSDAIAFVSKLQHNTLYQVFDLVTGEWVTQQYTYLEDKNEQETTEKMLHGYRMGWLKLFNK